MNISSILKIALLGLALSIGPISLYAQEEAPVNTQQETQEDAPQEAPVNAPQETQEETQESSIPEAIIGLLESGKWFEAEALYKNLPEAEDPILEAIYSWRKLYYGNRYDEAIKALKDIFFCDNDIEEGLRLHAIAALVNLHADNNDYDGWIYWGEQMQGYLEDDLFKEGDAKAIKDQLTTPLAESLQNAKRWKSYGDYSVVKKGGNDTLPILTDTVVSFPLIEISLNDSPAWAALDTGAQPVIFLQSPLANRIGARMVTSDQDSLLVNNRKMAGYYGVIDSIQVGSYMIYNAPCTVLSAGSENFSMCQHDLQLECILGMSFLKLIDSFSIDWENQEVSFAPIDLASYNDIDTLDLSYFQNKLFARLCLSDGECFSTFVDTGGLKVGLNFDCNFKEAHPSPFEGKESEDTIIHDCTMNGLFDSDATIWKDIPVKFSSDSDAQLWLDAREYHSPEDIYSLTMISKKFLEDNSAKSIFDFRAMKLYLIH